MKMLRTKIDEVIGDMANKADIGFNFSIMENYGISMKFSGYSDKIDVFIQKFYQLILETAETGFQEDY